MAVIDADTHVIENRTHLGLYGSSEQQFRPRVVTPKGAWTRILVHRRQNSGPGPLELNDRGRAPARGEAGPQDGGAAKRPGRVRTWQSASSTWMTWN